MVGTAGRPSGRTGSHETHHGSFSERSSMDTANANQFSEEVAEVLAARAASKNIHFSRSVGIVGVGTVSYLWWIWLLCSKPPPDLEVQEAFYREVDSTIYLWPMVAFATANMLNIISWIFERRTTKKQLCFLAVYISTVALLYEFLAWRKWAPIYVTASGRPNSILRYIMWGHATPAMLYAMGMMSDLSRQRVANTIAMDIVMIVTALPGELVGGWQRWMWNFISWAVSPYVFHSLWVMYSAAIRESTDEGSRKSLRALRNCTLVFWCSFPAVWTAVQLGLVDLRTEEILWSCSDFLGKIVFSSTLMHGNFMTIEHRRYMAMRVVEEANRVRVIQELRDLLEQKEQFIALMSHELRTPLNGIIGLSNTLLTDGGGMDADAQKTVSTIHNSGCRLLNLINDILDAAALKKGTLVVQQCKVNLKNVTDDVLDLTQPLAKPGITVTNRIGSGVPPVVGDTARIVQVLYNLIGNACKFTDKGDIWVDAAVNGDMVAVRVHDTGIGIPQDKLDDIFCAFQQVDMSTTRRYGGTGLGLNLVKQLVEAHGGSISVASKPGTGSTFTFMLKVWDNSRMASPQQASLLSLGGGPPEALPLLGPVPSDDDRLAAAGVSGLRLRRSSAEHYPGSGRRSLSGAAGGSGSTRRHSLSGPPPTILEGLDGDTLAEDPAALGEMWRRLSIDCKTRSSYEAEASQYHKAPQQLDPAAAASVFASAVAPPPRPPPQAALPERQRRLLEAQQQGAGAGPAAPAPQEGGRGDGAVRQQQQQPPGEAPREGEAPHAEGAAAAQQPQSQAQQQQEQQDGGSDDSEETGSWLDVDRGVREAEKTGAIQVLSVDDDPVNQMVIQRMLSKAGFRVIKAATGDKALDLVQERVVAGAPPDLVLLDVMMPGMSGYEVARFLRAQYPHLLLPIILVSANKLEEHVVEGLEAGGNDYVTKPFGQKELIARIEAQLRLKRFAEAAAARAAACAGVPASRPAQEQEQQQQACAASTACCSGPEAGGACSNGCKVGTGAAAAAAPGVEPACKGIAHAAGDGGGTPAKASAPADPTAGP